MGGWRAQRSVRLGRGKRGGRDVHERVHYSGRTTEMSYEITAVEPPNRFAMVGTGPFPFEGELLLTATPTGTRVTNSIDAGADGRFTKVMFTVLGPLMRRLMAGQLGKELEILKGELESTPSTEATA
nr:SRPBCC family protein [Haladaptatus sp. QDMS2]